MNPYKIQNRSDTSRRVKFQKNGGSITFVTTPQDNYVENSREAGFCLQPIDTLPLFDTTTSSITLTALPMGVDGRITLFINGIFNKSVRYSSQNSIVDRANFFSTEFGDYANWVKQDNDIFIFNITNTADQVRFVFEDDDIDFILNEFTQTDTTNNPTLIVEQYRLSFDLKATVMISCDGAKEEIKFLHYSDLIESGATCTLTTDTYQNTVALSGGIQNFINDFNQNFSEYCTLTDIPGEDIVHFTINANVNSDVRVSFTIPWDFSSIQEIPFDGTTMNGTSVITGGTLSFCLAKQPILISCVGASSTIRFPQIRQRGWDIEFDGQLHYLENRTIDDYVNLTLNGGIMVGSDGFMDVTVTDSSEHRVRLIPQDPADPPPYTAPEDPTFVILPDGSIGFCLAPDQP